MRTFKVNSVLLLFSLAAVSCWGLLVGVTPASGGEPIVVAGQFGTEGQPFLWNPPTGILYRTDGGDLGKFNNTQANTTVDQMFQVWEDVTTASISFTNNGSLKAVGAFAGGDVDTVAEFDAVDGSCDDERLVPSSQSPIIYDDDGTLFTALGFSSGVIGFAGPCAVDSQNRIRGGSAALNGKFIDTLPIPELTENEFRQAFTHEFGHFAGLGHSQINVEVLSQFPSCNSDDVVGLPLMFPILQCDARVTLGLDPLAPDDIAWISLYYPGASYSTSYGSISGEILFSDGTTPVQGGNVIAREPDNMGTGEREDRRNAVSAVSGFLFTGNPGQSVTGTNTGGSNFGSRDATLIGFYEIPILAGSYTVEVEGIDPGFTAGSSVGPLGDAAGEQIPLPAVEEFWNTGESNSDNRFTKDPVSVTANVETAGIDIILNNTGPRFDGFESGSDRNETVTDAVPLSNGTFSASISPFDDLSSSGPDTDYYRLQATAATVVTVEITAKRLDPVSALDSVIEIVDGSSTRFTTCRDAGTVSGVDGSTDDTPDAFDDPCVNDDIDLGNIRDSKLEFEVPGSGSVQFYLRVLDFRGDARPDFFYDLTLSGVTTPDNPVPVLTSFLSPSSIADDADGFTLTVFGSGFVSGAEVRWNGSGRTTTFESGSVLTAVIPSSDITGSGTAQITVFNPTPGGGLSNSLPFAYNTSANLVPAVAAVSWSTARAAGAGLTLTVQGSDFAAGAVVRWNGAALATEFHSARLLTASLPARLLARSRSGRLIVHNPAPGGGTSNAVVLSFALSRPTPPSRARQPSGRLYPFTSPRRLNVPR